MIIIHEHEDLNPPSDNTVNSDDEGERPAGSIFFDFDDPITEFGFDLVDIEGADENGHFASFMLGNNPVGQVSFMDFQNTEGAIFGNNTINRISPISFHQGNVPQQFDRVEIYMGGSGAVDNVNWGRFEIQTSPSAPEPVTATLTGICLSLLGLSIQRRAR
ncbi:MAG: hypothetical protein CMJ18_26085 [Phycisphaeraceae bacterium]|nr:hypothetical protein [Phycisphaeraceae bacterium]